MSFFCHPQDTATNCGKQMVALYQSLTLFIFLYLFYWTQKEKKLNSEIKLGLEGTRHTMCPFLSAAVELECVLEHDST